MKTKSEAKIELVAHLARVIDVRKSLEKQEKDLKEQVKALMGDAMVLEAGDFSVVISQRNRRDLDKDAIAHDMGQDFVAKYTKVTTYDTMEIKAAKRAALA